MSVVKVGLICGGESDEHEISCISALSIFDAIDRKKFQPTLLGISQDGEGFIELQGRESFDSDQNGLPIVPKKGSFQPLDPELQLLFPILHGANGEDGVFQGYADFLGFNYLGSGVLASALAMDKAAAKDVFIQNGLKVARGEVIKDKNWKNNKYSYPFFVKPAAGGSSRGTAKVKSESEVFAAINEALKYDDKVLIEEAISGREIECGVLVIDGEVKSSVLGEIKIVGAHEFYDYEAKYLDSATQLLIPAPVSDEISERVQTLAKKAFTAIGCEGLARVDFFLTEGNEIIINEINTMPGFTSKSAFPLLWKATGLSYPQLITTLIEGGLAKAK
jgi:D-alanine-D-alanine ligase